MRKVTTVQGGVIQYNSLPEEQQLAISAVPPDLLEESGLVKTEDAEVSAQEDELCGYPLAPEEVE